MLYLCFFFFKQKTAYEMRISDWSSDVCSSDLHQRNAPQFTRFAQRLIDMIAPAGVDAAPSRPSDRQAARAVGADLRVYRRKRPQRLPGCGHLDLGQHGRTEAHTAELQSTMRNSYAGICLKKKTKEKLMMTTTTISKPI